MPDLAQALDSLDRLITLSAPVAPEADLIRAAEVARRARRRRSLLGETVVVALAGGTGSGKSSLLNAIAGEEVAATGAQRPVTSEPLAWIPSNPEPGLVRLLDAIGIETRIGHDSSMKVALIDLPDTDSFELSHRELVARLIPQIDAVVWVVDPEKYHDRVLHEDHIAPLAEHADRFVFALNQVDRIGSEEAEAIVSDLRRGLQRDGIASPVVVEVAADPPVGPPLGIEDLIGAIGRMGDAKSIVRDKLVADIKEAAWALADAAGIRNAAGTGFSAAWSAAIERAGDAVSRSVLAVGEGEMARYGAMSGRAAVAIWPRRPPPAPEARVEPRGLVPAAGAIHDALVATAERAGDETRRRLRSLDVDGEVATAVRAVVAGFEIRRPDLPGWLAPLAWVRRAALALIVVAVAMAIDRDGMTWPAVLAVAGAAVVTGVSSLAAAVGRKSAIEAASASQADLARRVVRELDRRLGAPARAMLRDRAEASAAMADFELLLQALD